MACISNTAYEEAAYSQADAIRQQAITDTAIYAGLALWQRNSSSSITNMQTGIADRQLKLAEAIADHAKKFWPAEVALLEDAFMQQKTTPQYTGLMAAWSNLVDDTMRRGRTDWIAEMKQRCLSATRCEAARWDRLAQNARADMLSYSARQAEARSEVLNDQRYSRQLVALGLGRDQIMTVPSYQSIAGTLGGNARQMLMGTINSGLEALGYYQTRQEVDGWGQGIRNSFDRMPYQEPAQTMPVRQQYRPEAYPIEPVARVESRPLDPCGPMPGATASDAEWRRWDRCKGNK